MWSWREFRRSESNVPDMEAASLDNRAGMPFEGGTNVNYSQTGAYSSGEVLQPYGINVRLAKWNFITVVDRLVEKSPFTRIEKEHW